MNALTCLEHSHFALPGKPEPEINDPRDAVVRVTPGRRIGGALANSLVYAQACYFAAQG